MACSNLTYRKKSCKMLIRMVLESIYDSKFPNTSDFHSGRGRHSTLRQIKEEWETSCWILEFDIRKCFHTIDSSQSLRKRSTIPKLILLLHSESLFRRTTRRRWERSLLLCPTQYTTIDPTKQHLETKIE